MLHMASALISLMLALDPVVDMKGRREHSGYNTIFLITLIVICFSLCVQTNQKHTSGSEEGEHKVTENIG